MPKPTLDEPQRDAKDKSASLLWTLFAPINEITEDNAKPIVEWLEDRAKTLTWFTSIITGSLVLLTLFGRKPGFEGINQTVLSVSLLLMFASILCNLICVWQIPKWKLAIRTGQLSNGRKMTLDLEIMSWISLFVFLASLVCAAIGNGGRDETPFNPGMHVRISKSCLPTRVSSRLSSRHTYSSQAHEGPIVDAGGA